MSAIFLCYRREDTRGFAGRVYDRLKQDLGPHIEVFRDVEAIQPGTEYKREIDRALQSCGVLIALIGKRWLDGGPSERRRIEDPNDLVRLEIATALERKITLIPVLVEGADMPTSGELPGPLKGLPEREALRMSDDRFEYDFTRLVKAIRYALGEGPGQQNDPRVQGDGRLPVPAIAAVVLIVVFLIGSLRAVLAEFFLSRCAGSGFIGALLLLLANYLYDIHVPFKEDSATYKVAFLLSGAVIGALFHFSAGTDPLVCAALAVLFPYFIHGLRVLAQGFGRARGLAGSHGSHRSTSHASS